mmetsp:Transcript_20560/g.44938  ORF Transcript_20560/g.44938 Transcript_20560/m.44938 type:complete len:233 (+) Transcript_20560:3927-4625(+)
MSVHLRTVHHPLGPLRELTVPDRAGFHCTLRRLQSGTLAHPAFMARLLGHTPKPCMPTGSASRTAGRPFLPGREAAVYRFGALGTWLCLLGLASAGLAAMRRHLFQDPGSKFLLAGVPVHAGAPLRPFPEEAVLRREYTLRPCVLLRLDLWPVTGPSALVVCHNDLPLPQVKLGASASIVPFTPVAKLAVDRLAAVARRQIRAVSPDLFKAPTFGVGDRRYPEENQKFQGPM